MRVSTVPCQSFADVSPPYTPGDRTSHLPILSLSVLPSPVKWRVGISVVSVLSGDICTLRFTRPLSTFTFTIATHQLANRSALYRQAPYRLLPIRSRPPILSPGLRHIGFTGDSYFKEQDEQGFAAHSFDQKHLSVFKKFFCLQTVHVYTARQICRIK